MSRYSEGYGDPQPTWGRFDDPIPMPRRDRDSMFDTLEEQRGGYQDEIAADPPEPTTDSPVNALPSSEGERGTGEPEFVVYPGYCCGCGAEFIPGKEGERAFLAHYEACPNSRRVSAPDRQYRER